MSNGDHWMPLYIGDYLADTMELNGPEHGAYLLLLMHYWRNGPLVDDDAKLASIAKTDLRLWRKSIGPTVRAFFALNGDGRLHQKRADIERSHVSDVSAKRSEAGKAGAQAKHRPPNGGGNGSGNCQAFASGVPPPLPGFCQDFATPHLDPDSESERAPPISPPFRGGRRRRDGIPRFRNGFLEIIAREGMPSQGIKPDDENSFLAAYRRLPSG